MQDSSFQIFKYIMCCFCDRLALHQFIIYSYIPLFPPYPINLIIYRYNVPYYKVALLMRNKKITAICIICLRALFISLSSVLL